jgi:hypothetical protein
MWNACWSQLLHQFGSHDTQCHPCLGVKDKLYLQLFDEYRVGMRCISWFLMHLYLIWRFLHSIISSSHCFSSAHALCLFLYCVDLVLPHMVVKVSFILSTLACLLICLGPLKYYFYWACMIWLVWTGRTSCTVNLRVLIVLFTIVILDLIFVYPQLARYFFLLYSDLSLFWHICRHS